MTRPKWRDYSPQLRIAKTTSGATDPVLGTNCTQAGRWLYLPDQRIVIADFICGFGSSGSGGSGGPLVVSLPIRAKRHFWPYASGVGFDTGSNRTAGGQPGDRPLGSAYIGRVLQFKGVTVYPNIADVAPFGEDRDSWAQFFCPYQEDSGSSSVAIGTTSIAVTFAMTLQQIPTAAQISVVRTSGPLTGTQRGFWLSSISTTGFTVNIDNNSTNAMNFDWSVHMNTCIWVDPASPWAWGTQGDGIYGKFIYEPAAPPSGF